MGPDFPSLADEIAEPRPDMNIKVTAFTELAKSSSICESVWEIIHSFGSCTNTQTIQ